MARPDSTKDNLTEIPHLRNEPRPDFNDRLPKVALPKEISSTLDNDEKFMDLLYEGKTEDSTDSNVRYAAYASRLRTIMMSAHRYVAYTSDIGESFRPIAHPGIVRTAYGVSWAYLVGDVTHEGYKAFLRNQRAVSAAGSAAPDNASSAPGSAGPEAQVASEKERKATETAGQMIASLGRKTPLGVAPIDDYRTVMAQRAVFQGLASMGLPAFTIHSIVRYSGRALKDASNKTVRTWGPIGLGLAAVPFLPFIFDKPVEIAVEKVFETAFGPSTQAGGHGHGHGGGGSSAETKKEL